MTPLAGAFAPSASGVPPSAQEPAPQRPRALWTPWTHPPSEVFLLMVWFWTTTVRFVGDDLILYALTGYFMAGVYIHRMQVKETLKFGWVLLLYPAWVLLSLIWSESPPNTLKLGLQLVLSVLICLYVATRISRRGVIVAMFLALCWFVFRTAPDLASGGIPGMSVFGDKNLMAVRMCIATFAAVTIAFDQGFRPWLRMAAVPIALVAVLLLSKTMSATSTLTGVLGVGLIGAFALVWRPARGRRALIVAVMCLAASTGAFVMASNPNTDVVAQVLDAVGKDRTLTGRTDLWAHAIKMIEQKPLLGVGAAAYWIPERMDAQALLDTFYKPRATVFSFHNSYLEVAVGAGLIGLGLAMAGWLWTLWTMMRQFFVESAVPVAFFAAMAAVALTRSFVEIDLWRPFELVQMAVWIGALLAARDLQARAAARRASQHKFIESAQLSGSAARPAA